MACSLTYEVCFFVFGVIYGAVVDMCHFLTRDDATTLLMNVCPPPHTVNRLWVAQRTGLLRRRVFGTFMRAHELKKFSGIM